MENGIGIQSARVQPLPTLLSGGTADTLQIDSVRVPIVQGAWEMSRWLREIIGQTLWHLEPGARSGLCILCAL